MKHYEPPKKDLWTGRISNKWLYLHEKVHCTPLDELLEAPVPGDQRVVPIEGDQRIGHGVQDRLQHRGGSRQGQFGLLAPGDVQAPGHGQAVRAVVLLDHVPGSIRHLAFGDRRPVAARVEHFHLAREAAPRGAGARWDIR